MVGDGIGVPEDVRKHEVVGVLRPAEEELPAVFVPGAQGQPRRQAQCLDGDARHRGVDLHDLDPAGGIKPVQVAREDVAAAAHEERAQRWKVAGPGAPRRDIGHEHGPTLLVIIAQRRRVLQVHVAVDQAVQGEGACARCHVEHADAVVVGLAQARAGHPARGGDDDREDKRGAGRDLDPGPHLTPGGRPAPGDQHPDQHGALRDQQDDRARPEQRDQEKARGEGTGDAAHRLGGVDPADDIPRRPDGTDGQPDQNRGDRPKADGGRKQHRPQQQRQAERGRQRGEHGVGHPRPEAGVDVGHQEGGERPRAGEGEGVGQQARRGLAVGEAAAQRIPQADPQQRHPDHGRPRVQ